MKATTLIIGTIALAINLASCQNNTTKETDHSMNMDSGHMNLDTSSMHSAMSGSMDKMMQDMHQMQKSGNVDYDFAMMMKSHHQGAVNMAQTEVNSGADETLKQMAKKIVDTQQAEINELESFLNSHKNPDKNYDPAKKTEGFAKIMDQNMTMMMNMPKMHGDASTDKQFIQMMIPHHQSAVQMAEGFIKHGKDQGLISMAKKIIADQKKEIEEFKKWDESHN